MKKIELFVIICIMTFLVYPAQGIVDNSSNNSGSITYRTFVDTYKGLYKVINMNTKEYSLYENTTLNINIGDTVEWINDDDIGITIISKENLWKDKYGYMKSTWKRFNYTFVKPGNYTFYIRQYATKFQPQKVIVRSVGPIGPIKSDKNRTIKSNSTINTSRKTVVRITNSNDSMENSSYNNESEKESSNWPGDGINKFSNEIFLSIMIVCSIYIMGKFKKKT